MAVKSKRVNLKTFALTAALLLIGCSSSDTNVTGAGPVPPGSVATVSTDAELRSWLASNPFREVDWATEARAIQEGGATPALVQEAVLGRTLGQALAPIKLAPGDAAFLNTAFQAYLWGYGPMTVYRLQRENTNTKAPPNQFFHAHRLANWQLPSPVSAPDMDVLYSSAFLELNSGPRVLTVPPLLGYYVVQIDDAFGNSNASLGERTEPKARGGSYLIVGPDDPGYRNPRAYVDRGYDEHHVVPIDTPNAWLIVRVPLDPYAPVSGAPADYTASPAYQANTRFALGTLADPTPSPASSPFTAANTTIANRYANPPASGREYFQWLGEAMAANPIPVVPALVSLVLPPFLMAPSPSAAAPGQAAIFASFAPLGLDATGFHPEQLSERQLVLLEAAAAAGQAALRAGQQQVAVDGPATQHHWHVTGTSAIGKYPNSWKGWFVRSVAGFEGGIASLAVDGTYPLTAYTGDGNQLVGGGRYKMHFDAGQLPPIELPGFWSVTVYSDTSASLNNTNTPAVAEAAVNNVFYSAPPTLAVTVADPTHFRGSYQNNDTIYFAAGTNVTGLNPLRPYFVCNASSGQFQLSPTWNPSVANMTALTVGNSTGNLLTALVTPVHSLGSQQLGQGLQLDVGGGLDLYLQYDSPGAERAGNWLPIPASGNFQVMMRLYHPRQATPVSGRPSILSPTTIPLTTSDPFQAQQNPQEPITSENRYGTYVVPGILPQQ